MTQNRIRIETEALQILEEESQMMGIVQFDEPQRNSLMGWNTASTPNLKYSLPREVIESKKNFRIRKFKHFKHKSNIASDYSKFIDEYVLNGSDRKIQRKRSDEKDSAVHNFENGQIKPIVNNSRKNKHNSSAVSQTLNPSAQRSELYKGSVFTRLSNIVMNGSRVMQNPSKKQRVAQKPSRPQVLSLKCSPRISNPDLLLLQEILSRRVAPIHSLSSKQTPLITSNIGYLERSEVSKKAQKMKKFGLFFAPQISIKRIAKNEGFGSLRYPGPNRKIMKYAGSLRSLIE